MCKEGSEEHGEKKRKDQNTQEGQEQGTEGD